MKTSKNINQLIELALSQWSLFTSAQALALGVSRTQLSRMAGDGRIEQMARGTWHVNASGNQPDLGAKAAWLSLFPEETAWERLRKRPYDAVATGRTAAVLHGDTEFHPDPFVFAVGPRKRTVREDVRLCAWTIAECDIELADGLPIASIERTTSDLIRMHDDPSIVDDFVRGAVSRGADVNVKRLAKLLAPLSARNGYEKDDGASFAHDIIIRDVLPERLALLAQGLESALGYGDAIFGEVDPGLAQALPAQTPSGTGVSTRPPESPTMNDPSDYSKAFQSLAKALQGIKDGAPRPIAHDYDDEMIKT